MTINYTKLNCALSIFLIITVLFIASCSKKGSPNPGNGTQTDNTPTITSISPGSGEYNTEVVIYGTNFSSTLTDDKVYFNGKAATVTAATSTQLTVKVPQDAGTGAVTISVKGGTIVTGPVFGYAESSKITSIDVSSGTPGTVVKITGTGFSTTSANDQVYFNGKAATITAATATLLTVTVPAGANTGPITLSVNAKPAVTGPVFTYIETLKITSTDVNKGIAGATVNITGTGFSTTLTDNKVFFNGMAATVSAATATQITVKVPHGCGVGLITMTVGNQNATGPNFDYYIESTVTTLAGSELFGFANGTGTSASFAGVVGIGVDGNGNVYVSDDGNSMIRKITSAGVVTTMAGGPSSDIVNPGSLTVTKSGTVFFSQPGSIRKVTPSGDISTYISGVYTANPPIGVTSIVTGDDGTLYITDYNNALIRKTSGNSIITLAGNGKGTPTNGTGTNAIFGQVLSIALDGNGNLYVGEYNNGPQIKKINTSNQVTTFSTTYPGNFAADKNGNLYESDGIGNQIKVINQAGVVSIIAGVFGTSGIYGNVDGDQYTAKFYHPSGIAIDDTGNLYVTDANRVRKITIKQ